MRRFFWVYLAGAYLRLPRDLKWLALSLLLWGVGESLFFYILPLYIASLGADPVQIGLVLSLAGLAMTVTLIPAGLVADHWGRKQVMVAGWVVGVLACALIAAARSLPMFTLGYVLYASTAWVIPPISGYVSAGRGDLTPERVLTVVFAGFSLGSIFSPALGGWLGEAYGWPAVFWTALAMFVLSTTAILFIRPQPVTPPAGEGGRYRLLLSNRRLMGFGALIFVVWFALWIGMPLAPNYLQAARDLTLGQVGRLGSAGALGAVALALLFGHRPPRRGWMAAQVCYGLYLILLLQARWMGWLSLAYFLRSGLQVSRSLVDAQTARVVNPAEVGLAFGLTQTIAGAAMVISPYVAGYLYDLRPALPFEVSLALVPLMIALTYFLAPRREAEPAAAGAVGAVGGGS